MRQHRMAMTERATRGFKTSMRLPFTTAYVGCGWRHTEQRSTVVAEDRWRGQVPTPVQGDDHVCHENGLVRRGRREVLQGGGRLHLRDDRRVVGRRGRMEGHQHRRHVVPRLSAVWAGGHQHGHAHRWW